MTDTSQLEQLALELEIVKTQAEITKLELETEEKRLDLEVSRVALADKKAYSERQRRKERYEDGSFGYNIGEFRLGKRVDDDSVSPLVAQLHGFHRVNPKGDIVIRYSSPGGSVYSGYELYDTLRQLSLEGHHVTTVITGYAASMAGILVQAGDNRVIGANSWLHLHEVSSGAIGKTFELEDAAERAKRLTQQACRIYAERAAQVNPDAWSAEEIYDWIKKNERWLSAEEALELGFVDEVR